MSAATIPEPTRQVLDGVPWVDVAGDLQKAIRSGRSFAMMMREILALWRGPGELTIAEYFYYGLWRDRSPLSEKRKFVGKKAQAAMHMAACDYAAYAAAEDKLYFHSIASAAGLPVPELLAVVHPTRSLVTAPSFSDRKRLAATLRDPVNYPLFGKPIDGKFSLGVISADRVDGNGRVILAKADPVTAEDLADRMISYPRGMLIQRRLAPHPRTRAQLSPGLCSIRLLVLLTANGPVATRAVCKIPSPDAVADNYWRPGAVACAVDVSSGEVVRSVRGTAADLEVDPRLASSGISPTGCRIPDWAEVVGLAKEAGLQFPFLRTQSWDIALTDRGPVLLELNFGGDLNLLQLAHGKGLLDELFVAHLASVKYERKRSTSRLKQFRQAMAS